MITFPLLSGSEGLLDTVSNSAPEEKSRGGSALTVGPTNQCCGPHVSEVSTHEPLRAGERANHLVQPPSPPLSGISFLPSFAVFLPADVWLLRRTVTPGRPKCRGAGRRPT